MYFRLKNHIYIISLFFFIILSGCQIKESTNNHGILFLENRANKLKINETNKNDVIKLIGIPHSKSINNENEWIYIERVFIKGEFAMEKAIFFALLSDLALITLTVKNFFAPSPSTTIC